MNSIVAEQPRLLAERRGFDHLLLIKAHMLSLRFHISKLKNASLTPMSVVALRHAFADVRIIIEEIVLLSVSAHHDAGETVTQALRKEYRAEKKMTLLERINPQFFPEAIKIVPSDVEGTAGRFVARKKEHLTRDNVNLYYHRCGEMLHASSKSLSPKDFLESLELVLNFFRLTACLLKTFTVDISGKGYLMAGHLKLNKSSLPLLFKAQN